MERRELEVFYRAETGKGPARRLRRQGMVPAIFYGHREEPIPLAVRLSDLRKILSQPGARRSFLTLVIKGMDGAEVKKLAILKEVQRDALKDMLLHVDFQGIAMEEEIYMEVPVHVVGKAKGVEKGGVLEVNLREIEVKCLPEKLPSRIDVDVSDLDIGDAIHVGDLKIEGVKILTDPDQAIVTVVPPTVEEEAAEEAEAVEVPSEEV
ncbi:MAG: 50S ribosomal protein L25 [Deltaproteobacteria bacterium]|nr:MAG: 50S ribosomal protein L25 [Deltaproteobacteria bacterium]HEX16781.1 50S ribosomal protein L25/general stress protein Ctc [Deltaproteobacteria bacterium]